MWAKKLLLLSCLYPLFLLFVIAYTAAYTMQKPQTTHTISQQGLVQNSRVLYSSTSSHKVSQVAFVSKQQSASAAAELSITPTPTATPSAPVYEKSQNSSSSALQIAKNVTPGAVITSPIPSNQQLYQRAMQNRSVVILDQATSSAITSGSSSYIIEASPSQALGNMVNQPRTCAADGSC